MCKKNWFPLRDPKFDSIGIFCAEHDADGRFFSAQISPKLEVFIWKKSTAKEKFSSYNIPTETIALSHGAQWKGPKLNPIPKT